MGQACMKTGDGSDNTKKVSKCSKCNYPIVDVIFNSFVGFQSSMSSVDKA